MILLLTMLCPSASASPWLVGAGVRQVFREDAIFDAITLSGGPTWGALGVQATAALGLSPLSPTDLDRTLAQIADANGAGDGWEPGITEDRATLGLQAVWSPPLPTTPGLHGGPRAMLGLEGRLLQRGHLSASEAGDAVAGLDGWSLVDDGAELALSPVVGLGVSMSPAPRTALRLDLQDRMLVLTEDGESADGWSAPGLRHDVTLSLDAVLALGGGR